MNIPKKGGQYILIFITHAYLGMPMREIKMLWDLMRMRVKMFGSEEQSERT